MSTRREVTLTRGIFSPFGTFSHLDTGSFECETLERPEPQFGGDHPCIPVGEYDVDWTDDGRHPKHNPCYEVMNVPGRTAILIHAANVYEQLLGCIAPGSKVEQMSLTYDGAKTSHLGVSGSGPALNMLLDDLHRQNFRLIIKEVA